MELSDLTCFFNIILLRENQELIHQSDIEKKTVLDRARGRQRRRIKMTSRWCGMSMIT
jgi:hypothetical protein